MATPTGWQELNNSIDDLLSNNFLYRAVITLTEGKSLALSKEGYEKASNINW